MLIFQSKNPWTWTRTGEIVKWYDFKAKNGEDAEKSVDITATLEEFRKRRMRCLKSKKKKLIRRWSNNRIVMRSESRSLQDHNEFIVKQRQILGANWNELMQSGWNWFKNSPCWIRRRFGRYKLSWMDFQAVDSINCLGRMVISDHKWMVLDGVQWTEM